MKRISKTTVVAEPSDITFARPKLGKYANVVSKKDQRYANRLLRLYFESKAFKLTQNIRADVERAYQIGVRRGISLAKQALRPAGLDRIVSEYVHRSMVTKK